MTDLFYYRPPYVTAAAYEHLPGIKRLRHYTTIYSGSVPLDRSGVIKVPIRTKIAFPIPAFRPYTKTYEETCNERAQTLLRHAESKNLPIRVLYSGGIDSTTVLISLLKQATPEQKARITVLLSERSIMENPRFFSEHILGKLAIASSENFRYLIGGEALFLSGEHNDQVFGSDMIGHFMKVIGGEHIHKKYNRDLFLKLFNTIVENIEENDFLLNLFEDLKAHAPVPIETNYDLLWWINFTLKWHTVFFRQIAFTSPRNVHRINKEYFDTYFFTFFNTEEFQLWSMNNLDKRMKDTWNTYKWVAKELIYEYTKDAEYRDNKLKVGSLGSIVNGVPSHNFIDDTYSIVDKLSPEEFYLPDNSFI